MPLATPVQIRAARAMLDWTMVQLAEKARVSISTVKRYEDGQGAPASVGLMQAALETEDLCFMIDEGQGPGLRYRETERVQSAV